MSLATAIAIYFIIWWVVLFVVLPWGVRSQEEGGDVVSGSDPGAPAIPRLWWKLVWTTVVAAVVFALCAFVYVNRIGDARRPDRAVRDAALSLPSRCARPCGGGGASRSTGDRGDWKAVEHFPVEFDSLSPARPREGGDPG